MSVFHNRRIKTAIDKSEIEHPTSSDRKIVIICVFRYNVTFLVHHEILPEVSFSTDIIIAGVYMRSLQLPQLDDKAAFLGCFTPNCVLK